MKFYLVRHGESKGNIRKEFSGIKNVDLTDKGLEQAEIMAEKFDDIDINKIFASPLIRAQKTAKAIAKRQNHEIITIDKLHERNFGLIEGMNWDEIEKKYPEEAIKLINDREDYTFPEGESVEDVAMRGKDFYNLHQKDLDGSVIVAHACFILCFLFGIEVLDKYELLNTKINNCDVICLEDGKLTYI